MDALSPRDANAHIRVKSAAPKQKAAPAKLPSKEKDHPPPPPPEVKEPPSLDRPNGAVYKTGRCLGKGGFAICYEGQLSGTKQRYALKIVKSYMPQKKMEQKVRRTSPFRHSYLIISPVPNRAPNSLQDATRKCRQIPPCFHIRSMYIHCSGALSEWVTHGYGEEEKIHHRTRSPLLDSADGGCYQVHARQGHNPPRSENGKHIPGQEHECQGRRFWTCSSAHVWKGVLGCSTNNSMWYS